MALYADRRCFGLQDGCEVDAIAVDFRTKSRGRERTDPAGRYANPVVICPESSQVYEIDLDPNGSEVGHLTEMIWGLQYLSFKKLYFD